VSVSGRCNCLLFLLVEMLGLMLVLSGGFVIFCSPGWKLEQRSGRLLRDC